LRVRVAEADGDNDERGDENGDAKEAKAFAGVFASREGDHEEEKEAGDQESGEGVFEREGCGGAFGEQTAFELFVDGGTGNGIEACFGHDGGGVLFKASLFGGNLNPGFVQAFCGKEQGEEGDAEKEGADRAAIDEEGSG
jgi:hypothetical protein